MPTQKGTLFFGVTEVAIGSITLAGIITAGIITGTSKPLNVLIFVVLSSLVSISLGAGILRGFRLARKLLVFFSGWVILSKLLIFGRILFLCCELETKIPSTTKNTFSIIYHIALIYYLRQPAVKKEITR